MLAAATGTAGTRVDIDIGACDPGATCAGQARLVSEGSINVASSGQLQLREGAVYGTRELALGMGNINLGTAEAIARAAGASALPPGLMLNQQVLRDLLRGNTAVGAPALETLRLNAAEAINVFGSVDLDTRDAATGKPSLRSLVLGAPAIHGYGDSNDRARIFAAELTWSGQQGATSVLGMRRRSRWGQQSPAGWEAGSWTSSPTRCGWHRRRARAPHRKPMPGARCWALPE